MMDYHGFWEGFVLIFGVLPVLIGAVAGLIRAWHIGRRGTRLVLPILLGGAGAGLCVFTAAVFFFRF